MRRQEITLQFNRPLRIAGTTTIECVAGRVWLTRSDMPGDIFLRPGECHVLTWPEMALVEALGAQRDTARIVLHAPPASRSYLRRILRFLLSCLHERMRALRGIGRRGPLAG